MPYYYVSTTGNDGNDGTAPDNDHAWATIQYGISTISAGDVLGVIPGIYDENLVTGANHGTAENKFIVTAYGEGAVIVRPTGGTMALYVRGNYWRFNRFAFDGANLSSSTVQFRLVTYGELFYSIVINNPNNEGLYILDVDNQYIYNCLIAHNEANGLIAIKTATDTAVHLKNTSIFSNKKYGVYIGANCTLNYDYNLIFGNRDIPADNINIDGTGNDGGHNIIDVGPKCTSYTTNQGIICAGLDDYDISYFNDVAAAAEAAGGRVTVWHSYQAVDDIDDLQGLHDAGHEISLQGWSSQRLTNLNAFDIQYTGEAATCVMTVAASGITLNSSNDAEDHTIDLTAAANDHLSELIATIHGYANYTCTIAAQTESGVLSKSLADIADQDVKTASYTAQFDKRRLVNSEVGDKVTWLENNVTGLTVKTMAYQGGENDIDIQGYVRDLGLQGARAISAAGSRVLSSVEIYEVFGLHVVNLTGATEAIVRRNARHIAQLAKAWGMLLVVYSHHAAEITAANYGYLIDEWIKDSEITFQLFKDAVSSVRASHSTADNEITWTKTYPDIHDYSLQDDSPCIGAGIDVGLTEDYLGNLVTPGADPDIGAYEYQDEGWSAGKVLGVEDIAKIMDIDIANISKVMGI